MRSEHGWQKDTHPMTIAMEIQEVTYSLFFHFHFLIKTQTVRSNTVQCQNLGLGKKQPQIQY